LVWQDLDHVGVNGVLFRAHSIVKLKGKGILNGEALPYERLDGHQTGKESVASGNRRRRRWRLRANHRENICIDHDKWVQRWVERFRMDGGNGEHTVAETATDPHVCNCPRIPVAEALQSKGM
jgi:hypothetical protein